MRKPPPPGCSCADIVQPDSDYRRLCQSPDFAAVLRHQLSLPLESDLGQRAAGVVIRPESRSRTAVQPMTFGYVLHDPNPPLELLLGVKQYAKRCLADPHSILPQQVANVLYFVAIAAAKTRLGRRITSLQPYEIRDGIAWALQQPWLDEQTRAVLQAAVAPAEVMP